jgi:hypothetical protein
MRHRFEMTPLCKVDVILPVGRVASGCTKPVVSMSKEEFGNSTGSKSCWAFALAVCVWRTLR